MNQERLLQVLVEPKLSEKGARVADLHRQYMFKVEVEHVTTSTVHARTRNFKGRAGLRSNWKKAFVKLKEGFEINFGGGE